VCAYVRLSLLGRKARHRKNLGTIPSPAKAPSLLKSLSPHLLYDFVGASTGTQSSSPEEMTGGRVRLSIVLTPT